MEYATVTELTAALRSRELGCRELLDHLLARAQRLNPALNAIVAWDTDRARSAAAAADEAAARGEFLGPLHGLPMTVKDVFETEGLVTTSGAPALADYVPDADALAVARLRRAGAIVFGKTNTPMYAGDWQTYNDVYGRTGNPWDPARTAGGSSGGAGAAVAAGFTPLELGSDIGGSIRVPAHYNGVYGLKPSWGVVPVRGHIPGPPGSLVTVDVGVVGPLARSVADLRIALQVVAGPLPEDAPGWRLELTEGVPLADVAGLRIASVIGEGSDLLPLAAEVRACLDQFATRLAGAGAVVDQVPLPVSLADGVATWRDLVLPTIGSGLPDAEFGRLAALGQADSPAALTARGLTSSYRDWLSAVDRRQRQRIAWADLFERYDAVLAPVMPTVAFPHDTGRPLDQRVLEVDGVPVSHSVAASWCCAIGAMQLPVVALPVGPTAGGPAPAGGLPSAGLPAGLQLIGPFLSDLRLLRIAELVDAAAGPGFTPPPVS